jgi:predicted Zn-dependent protease
LNQRASQLQKAKIGIVVVSQAIYLAATSGVVYKVILPAQPSRGQFPMKQFLAVVVTASLLTMPIRANYQANAATATHIESGEDLDTRLTAAQKQQFEAAKKAHLAHQYAEALAGFRALLQDLPGDSLLLKYASNSALQMGDSTYALGVLRPIVQQNFEDWQAVSMLAWAAAESGDTRTRDAAMVNMAMLRQHGITPPNMTDYTVERIKVGENTMTVRRYLVPLGIYQIYYVGQVADAKGSTFLRITLESSDGDQRSLRKSTPKRPPWGFASLRWMPIRRQA